MARGAWWAISTWDLKELNMTEQLPRIRNSLDNGKGQTPNKQAKHNLYSIMGSYINLVYEAIKEYQGLSKKQTESYMVFNKGREGRIAGAR